MLRPNDSNTGFYDQCWEKEFSPPYLDAMLPAFEGLGILPDTKVLDIGCGNGALGEFLRQKYNCRMYGTDISPVALKAAEAKGYVVEKVTQDGAGSSRRPFPRVRFDVVVLSAILEHMFDPSALIRQAYSALRDGGHVVVLTPNITWFLNRILFALGIWDHPLMGGTPGHIRYLNKSMLERILIDAGFRDLDWSFSPIAVLPPGHELYVRGRRTPLIRRLVKRRARHWQSLLAENLVVLGRKPVSAVRTPHAGHDTPDRIDKLKVLHVAATANGASWMVDILRGLRGRGYEVSALISSGQGDLGPKLQREGIPYHVGDLDLFSSPSLISAARAMFRLANFLRRHRFDIVHYHLFASVISGRIAAWLADVPLRYSMITGPYHLEAPTPSKIDFRTLWMDTRIIASCEYTRQLYLKMGVSPTKIERIYYGADETLFDPSGADASKLRRELRIPASRPVVGMVAYFYAPLPSGSWTPPHLQGRAVKGHETLLEAAQTVLKKSSKVKFVLVGKGWGAVGEEYEEQVKKKAREMGLEKTMVFAGHRRDVPSVLAGFDVSVQCSLNENLGGTIESLLMARPTIATAVGGMIDSVRNRETGLLVPPDDGPRLAEAILNLLENPRRARDLGERGRRLMLQEFTLTKTVDNIDRLYQSAARRRLARRTLASTGLSTLHYRTYRTLLSLLVLSVVLPMAFLPVLRSLFARQLRPFIATGTVLLALPIWAMVRIDLRLNSRVGIISGLRRTGRLGELLERILSYARVGRLDFSGLKSDFDALSRKPASR